MKKQFLSYLNQQLAHNQKLLAMNSITEEDKALLQEAVDSLTTTIEEVDAMEEGDAAMEAIEALKTSVAELNESLTAVKEKINQNTKKEETNPEIMETNYLQSKNSVKDFAQAVRNSRNGQEFKQNWNAVLVQNGITIADGSADYFLPELVKGKIQDAWDKNSSWLADLNVLNGVKRYTVRKNDSTESAEGSRAKGHSKGNTKVAQSLTFSGKVITCQFIYKLQEIAVQDAWDDETIVDYIVNELVDRILYEEKRAILVGDGRSAESDHKINSIEAIAKSTSDVYTTVSSVTENGFLIDDMRAMCDNILNPNGKDIYVFMSKADLRTLSRVQASETSTPVYMSMEQVAEQIGATKIFTTDLLGVTYKAIAMIPSSYVLIGENVLNPTLYSWHEGYTNLDVYRYEAAVGGGIEGLQSTAVLKA